MEDSRVARVTGFRGDMDLGALDTKSALFLLPSSVCLLTLPVPIIQRNEDTDTRYEAWKRSVSTQSRMISRHHTDGTTLHYVAAGNKPVSNKPSASLFYVVFVKTKHPNHK